MRGFLVFFCWVFLFSTPVVASQSVRVEWGYTPLNTPPVTGYKLYQNGTARITWSGAETMAGDVTLDTLSVGDSFTLTALFNDSTESPHSSPFIWRSGNIIRFGTLKMTNTPAATTKPGAAQLR